MTENIYTSPQAELADENSIAGHGFYVVSITKFSVLFFTTFGLYAIYWFYKNWDFFRNATGEKMWPIPRAIFSIFFAHSLFNKVDATLKEKNIEHSWNPGLLATLYVIFIVVGNLLERVSGNQPDPLLSLVSTLILLAMYVPLVKAQKAINISQNDPDGQLNSNFSFANFLWILLGLGLWLMAVTGFLVLFGIIPGVDPSAV